MPEGDTNYRAARTLNRALAGARVTSFATMLPKLARVDEDAPLVGRTVCGVEARGKHQLMSFSGGLVLRTHMRMSGSWHLYRPGEPWQRGRSHMRIQVTTREFVAVGFDIPIADFLDERALLRDEALRQLGPDLLGDFDPAEAERRLRERGDVSVGEVLLNQRVLAGVGNVFKSEILFLCGVSPFRTVKSLAGDEVRSLLATAQRLLRANAGGDQGDAIVTYSGLRRTTGRSNPSERVWVYGRARSPCRRCGGPIACAKQGVDARVTYWCPRCQPGDSLG